MTASHNSVMTVFFPMTVSFMDKNKNFEFEEYSRFNLWRDRPVNYKFTVSSGVFVSMTMSEWKYEYSS